MLIKETDKLAAALTPILKTQVVVRYGVQKHQGSVEFVAELAVLVYWGRHRYLGHLMVSVSIERTVEVGKSLLVVTSLEKSPAAVHDLMKRWSHRPFDDWLHDTPFMGALGIFRDGQPYTSLKFDPSRWLMLTGVVLGEVKAPAEQFSGTDVSPEATRKVLKILKKRYSSFVAVNAHQWFDRLFT